MPIMSRCRIRTASRPGNAVRFRLGWMLLLAIVAVSFAGFGARAEGAAATLGTAELQTLFAGLIAKDAVLPGQDFEVANFTATPDSISLPAGTRDTRIISRSLPKPAGRQSFVVDILVEGVPQSRVTLSGDIDLYGLVVCATKTLPRHATVAEGDVELVRRSLNQLGPDAVGDPATTVGQELKTTVQAGAVLYRRFLKSPETVKRGAIVSILAISGPLKISVPGRVQTAGATGDLIKVKNLMSRREIFARVVSADTVQVDL